MCLFSSLQQGYDYSEYFLTKDSSSNSAAHSNKNSSNSKDDKSITSIHPAC